MKVTSKVSDTNIESVAKDAGIFNPENSSMYRPLPTIVGTGRPVKGVDEELLNMKVGDEKDFEFPPEKTFGTRKPALMDHVPQSFFKKRGITPVRGLLVRTRRGIAIVRSTSGGRILLDYNHPLAGRTLEYHVELIEEAKDLETRLRCLIEIRLSSIDPESHIVEIDGGNARIELNTGDLPEGSIGAVQSIIEHDASQYVPEITKILFGPEEVTDLESVSGPDSKKEEAEDTLPEESSEELPQNDAGDAKGKNGPC